MSKRIKKFMMLGFLGFGLGSPLVVLADDGLLDNQLHIKTNLIENGGSEANQAQTAVDPSLFNVDNQKKMATAERAKKAKQTHAYRQLFTEKQTKVEEYSTKVLFRTQNEAEQTTELATAQIGTSSTIDYMQIGLLCVACMVISLGCMLSYRLIKKDEEKWQKNENISM